MRKKVEQQRINKISVNQMNVSIQFSFFNSWFFPLVIMFAVFMIILLLEYMRKILQIVTWKKQKTDEWFRDEICFYVCLNVDVIWCSIPCHFMKHWVFDFGTNPSFNRRQYHSSCKLFIFSPHGQKCTQTDAHTHWRKLMRLAHKHRWTNDEASLIEQTLNEWRPSFCSFPLCSRCLWPSFIQENDSVMLLKYSSCDVSVTSFKA